MMVHEGCVVDDVPRGLAAGEVRALRLILASLHRDDMAKLQVLDEVGDCTECLRGLVRVLAGVAAGAGYRDRYGHERGVQIAEQVLAEAIDKRDRLLGGT
jgi:hypothetical protein